MKTIGIIPARMGSSRFPGKPLAPIAGVSMLERVWRGAKGYPFDRLVVATPDAEILAHAEGFGGEAVMTAATHERALDRCAEAAAILGAAPDDVVVCVQGDEPMVSAAEIAWVIEWAVDCHAPALLAVPLSAAEIADPDLVKTVVGPDGYVLPTTRAADRRARHRIGGLFAWRASDLLRFAALPPSAGEIAESCDINRWLDHRLVCVQAEAQRLPYLSVDRPADIAKVEAALLAGAPPWRNPRARPGEYPHTVI